MEKTSTKTRCATWQTFPKLVASAAVLLSMLATAPLTHATSDSSPIDPFYRQLNVIGLTSDNRLVRFKVRSPQRTTDIGVVSGLSRPDTFLIGIDFRVQDGKLYGVGNGGGVYTINPANAQAFLDSRLRDANGLITPQGNSFGVDFNPAADRLRIISDNGQNLRHAVSGVALPPNPPTSRDGTLTLTPPPFAPGTVLPAVTLAPGVTAACYTNNDLSPNTATTLFDIDTPNDQIVIQSPANNGLLVPTGKLGVDAGLPAGCDIYSRVVGGVTTANRAFAALLVNGLYGFYHFSPLVGDAAFLGNFRVPVVDIALPLSN